MQKDKHIGNRIPGILLTTSKILTVPKDKNKFLNAHWTKKTEVIKSQFLMSTELTESLEKKMQ